MLVRAISNKRKRQIVEGKFYAVFIENRESNEIRIIDGAGGLSVYDLVDFEISVKNIDSYEEKNGSLVYKLIDYPTFLEDYYNDNRKSVNDLLQSQINIFKEDLTSEELVKLITSEIYSDDEKIVFIEAVKNRIDDHLSKVLARYFQSKDNIEVDLLLSICILLSSHQNQEIYDLFLKYIIDDTCNNESVEKIVIEYFNTYN